MEECTHKGVECPHSGCGQLVSQSALLEHVKACPYRLVKCGQCNQEYPLIKEQVKPVKFDMIFNLARCTSIASQ